MSVENVHNIKGYGTVVTGKILTGTIKYGLNVICGPSKLKASVNSIKIHN